MTTDIIDYTITAQRDIPEGEWGQMDPQLMVLPWSLIVHHEDHWEHVAGFADWLSAFRYANSKRKEDFRWSTDPIPPIIVVDENGDRIHPESA